MKFPCRPDDDEVFTFVTPDYDSMTSASGIGDRVGGYLLFFLRQISNVFCKYG